MGRIDFFCALLVLCAAGCTRQKTQALLEPVHALGVVAADEAIKAAGTKKQIAIIVHDPSWGPASTAEQAFTARAKEKGYAVVRAKAASLGDPMHANSVGLVAPDFFDALDENPSAGAVVSFVGGPVLWEAQGARIKPDRPPVIVIATTMLGNVPGIPTDQRLLAGMLRAGIIQMAIIDGAEEPTAKVDGEQALFAQHYRRVKKETL